MDWLAAAIDIAGFWGILSGERRLAMEQMVFGFQIGGLLVGFTVGVGVWWLATVLIARRIY